jgi:hypothetical protein
MKMHFYLEMVQFWDPITGEYEKEMMKMTQFFFFFHSAHFVCKINNNNNNAIKDQ